MSKQCTAISYALDAFSYTMKHMLLHSSWIYKSIQAASMQSFVQLILHCKAVCMCNQWSHQGGRSNVIILGMVESATDANTIWSTLNANAITTTADSCGVSTNTPWLKNNHNNKIIKNWTHLTMQSKPRIRNHINRMKSITSPTWCSQKWPNQEESKPTLALGTVNVRAPNGTMREATSQVAGHSASIRPANWSYNRPASKEKCLNDRC